MRLAARLRLAACLACGTALALSAPQILAQSGKGSRSAAVPAGDWRTIDRDSAATRYSPLDDINRGNVTQLQQAWTYPLRAFSSGTPLVVDGIMYMTAGNRIVALDADSGKEVWAYEEPRKAEQGPGLGGSGFSSRGLSYWPGDGADKPRLVAMAGNRLVELDAGTGAKVASFGANGEIDVGVAYGGTPSIYKNVAVIGAATLENPVGVPGNPRAYDIKTGKLLWQFQTVPQGGKQYSETWGHGWKGRSGANMWSPSAPIDIERGLIFLPISGPAANYWGGDRPGTNLYANSVVAVDLETGKPRWHFQTVHHDIWDSDIPNAGVLFDVKVGGKVKPVIAHVGKTSYYYELDRATGEPVFPVDEVAVPKGDVPGEYYHPTQPIPRITPPLARMGMTYDDIVTAEDTTPEHAAACRKMWDDAGGYLNYGPFTPFYLHRKGEPPKSTIQFPGGTGGVNWGGLAVDPESGTVFANVQQTSLVGWVERKETTESYSFDANDTNQPYDRASVDGKGPFFSFSAPISGKYDAQGKPVGEQAPCYRPPWGRLTAVDARTGNVKWQVPLGLVEELPEGKRLVGNSGNAGPTVTAGGLVFVGATNDKRFRAFDSDTGRQLWETTLANNANANPLTYRGRSGKQYVAINAGGAIIAFSLR